MGQHFHGRDKSPFQVANSIEWNRFRANHLPASQMCLDFTTKPMLLCSSYLPFSNEQDCLYIHLQHKKKWLICTCYLFARWPMLLVNKVYSCSNNGDRYMQFSILAVDNIVNTCLGLAHWRYRTYLPRNDWLIGKSLLSRQLSRVYLRHPRQGHGVGCLSLLLLLLLPKTEVTNEMKITDTNVWSNSFLLNNTTRWSSVSN